MKINLEGKTALICGATKGIGQAIAKNLADQGVTIIALARNANDLKEMVKKLPNPDRHTYVSIDLSNSSDLQAKIGSLCKDYAIDILINNSAGPAPGTLNEAKISEFTQAFSQQVLAAQIMAQLLIPSMKQKKFGRIINIVSTSVRCPIQGLGVSNTIRGAMASWSKTLATEVAKDGITVNCVLPGYTNTERLKALIENKAKLNKRTFSEEENNWKNEVPAGRFAEPVEIAQLATFLCSDIAGYITGVAIPIDGGKTPSI